MIRMSLMEKLEMLKDIIMSNSYTFIIGISFIVIAIILFNTKKLDRDMLIKSCIGIYVIMFIFTILEFNKEFYGIIDYLINNVFFNLLFPSIATYAVTIIISNIIIVKSIFDKKRLCQQTNHSIMALDNFNVICVYRSSCLLVILPSKSSHSSANSSSCSANFPRSPITVRSPAKDFS